MKPIRNAKCWGVSTPVLLLPKLQVHRIMVAPQSECSIHLHRQKANRFYVESGELVIREFPGLAIHKDTVIRSGEIYDVLPNVTHQFIQPKGDAPDVIAYEMYWCLDGSDVRDDDIVRLREGRGSMVWAEGTNVVK